MRQENEQLKQAVAEMLLKNRFLKKTLNGVVSKNTNEFKIDTPGRFG